MGVVVLIGVLFAVSYVATIGTYTVPKTVTQDPALPQITLGGVTFHAEAFGDPANPAIIVLHGGPGGDYRSLLSLRALSDDYYVVFYDQHGSGLSQRAAPADLTVESSIEDLDQFVEHFGQGKPVNLVGHSWGGMLATAYAGRYPRKAAHLAVAEPGMLTNAALEEFQKHQAEPVDLTLLLRAGQLWFESLHVSGPDADAASDYFASNVAEAWWFSPRNGYECPGTPQPKDHFWRESAAAQSAILASARDKDGKMDLSVLTRGLQDYTNPTLMLVGECNRWIGLDYQKKYHLALYRDVQVVSIPRAGHDMFRENPEDTTAALRAFLSK